MATTTDSGQDNSTDVIINQLRTKGGFQLYGGIGRRAIINPLIAYWIKECELSIIIPKPIGYYKYFLARTHYLLARFNNTPINASNSSRKI